MLRFSILRSVKSNRVIIYNSVGDVIGKCATMFGAYQFFETLCKDLNCDSVTYSFTKDEYIIRVKIE